MRRPLRRIRPRLRSRHAVRAKDRRQYRRDPDEPAAARQMELTKRAPRRPRAPLDSAILTVDQANTLPASTGPSAR